MFIIFAHIFSNSILPTNDDQSQALLVCFGHPEDQLQMQRCAAKSSGRLDV